MPKTLRKLIDTLFPEGFRDMFYMPDIKAVDLFDLDDNEYLIFEDGTILKGGI